MNRNHDIRREEYIILPDIIFRGFKTPQKSFEKKEKVFRKTLAKYQKVC